MFLGFSHGQKGYKVYSLDTKKIIVSRDVMFQENLFPYLMKSEVADYEHEHMDTVPLLAIIDVSDDRPNFPSPEHLETSSFGSSQFNLGHFSPKDNCPSATNHRESEDESINEEHIDKT